MALQFWDGRPAAQQPQWPNQAKLDATMATLAGKPPLISAGEARRLIKLLGDVANGEAFVLQTGDCAETFRSTGLADHIRDTFKQLLQMTMILTYGAGVPIVKVPRIGGQFFKPRSRDTETRNGVTLEPYRGDGVNSLKFTANGRRPNPRNMLKAYEQAAATLNLLRALSTGGFASLQEMHAWNTKFVAQSPQGERYERVVRDIERALRFMAACGVDINQSALIMAEIFTGHEALLLPYETALTRVDSLTGLPYICSTHWPWLGERTRDPEGAHAELLSKICNPVAVKLGPTATPEEVLELCRRLNPDNIPGRLSFITRMGARTLIEKLPPILRAVREKGLVVVWICDPMHANTITAPNGYKTRRFDAIDAESEAFFAACEMENTWPGGIHLELTPDKVTECLGGGDPVEEHHLARNYATACDPRLNGPQGIEIAFRVSERLAALVARRR